MVALNKKDDLINLLLEETIVESSVKVDLEPLDFFGYFKNRSDDFSLEVGQSDSALFTYLKKKNVPFHKFSYNKKTQCLSGEISNHKLDIPTNWSVFTSVFKMMDSGLEGIFLLNEDNFDQTLNEVLSSLAPEKELFTGLMISEGTFYIVYLDPSNQMSTWLKSYFEESLSIENYKAA